MSEVAKIAKVSPATVSRVLRHPEIVNEKTRTHVLRVIKELNYEPHMIASQFRQRSTKTILVIVPDISNLFFSQVLRGIQYVAEEHDYKVILVDSQNDITKERQFLTLLQKKSADGVIMLTARLQQEELEEISTKYPMVLACEYMDSLAIPTVSIDNISSARDITEHLISEGHIRIGHITGPFEIVLSRDRLTGFKQAMLSHNIKIPANYIQEGEISTESGYKQMVRLLSLQQPPTAVFVFNDEMAFGAMKAAKDLGKKIPEDVAIVGFDNLELGKYMDPALTSMHQPKHEIGEAAMRLMLKQLKGEQITKRKIVLDNELIIRESTRKK